jgi:hypothetical protein
VSTDDRPRPRVIGDYRLAKTIHPSARHADIFARNDYERGQVRCEGCEKVVRFDDNCTAPQVPEDWYIATAETGTLENGNPQIGAAPVCPRCYARATLQVVR